MQVINGQRGFSCGVEFIRPPHAESSACRWSTSEVEW